MMYYKVTLDSNSCIMTELEYKDFLHENQEYSYQVSKIELSKEEYESLPEFLGW